MISLVPGDILIRTTDGKEYADFATGNPSLASFTPFTSSCSPSLQVSSHEF
jgi:hypothetical protein